MYECVSENAGAAPGARSSLLLTVEVGSVSQVPLQSARLLLLKTAVDSTYGCQEEALHSWWGGANRCQGSGKQPRTLPAPTYRDVIKEAKRQFAKNKKDFRIGKHTIAEEIKDLRERQERIDQEIGRLQEKSTKKPFEAKADFENFLHQLHIEADSERRHMESPSSSSGSSSPRSEGNSVEEIGRRPRMTLF
ncbi:protein FAM227B-like [Dipodomys merriami]|uniref:protein FAM227B-like n=1 Tax=Dipodomys merriami TaxID=94247 RepID=UPI00385573ED